jgi:hypothetical protein
MAQFVTTKIVCHLFLVFILSRLAVHFNLLEDFPIFNKPFLANFVSSKNLSSCLNACIFVSMTSKCTWHISEFKYDIAECQ